jgi:hypothetical protein
MLSSGNKLMDNGKKSLTYLINKFKLDFNKSPSDILIHSIIHNHFCHFIIRICHPLNIYLTKNFLSYRYTFSNNRTTKVIRRMSD